jgi:hypothetical protein
LVAWTLPWLCALAASVVLAYLANAALVERLPSTGAGISASAPAAARPDHADVAATCDTSAGRMLYVAALNACFPAEW